MQVSEIMKPRFTSIPHDADISAAAQRMRDMDVGMLPVEQDGDIVGAVTDRDITVRATASGADPNSTPVSDVMSNEIFVCVEDDDLKHAAEIMEQHQVRRLMVQNSDGAFVGMLSLADLARHDHTEQLSAEILEQVSQPGGQAAAH